MGKIRAWKGIISLLKIDLKTNELKIVKPLCLYLKGMCLYLKGIVCHLTLAKLSQQKDSCMFLKYVHTENIQFSWLMFLITIYWPMVS